ncbi:hypothetical protein GYMLUDRAFT_232806 [Collybiopsis luxurians FD-317 M1]|uniref:DUF6536 domain-containing protein n=1 Tax=Collybiopsis luxurians FD-317 M1 TaxID=944289 RepID=A0A0D0BV53_9AGAR|nr:hypothetical protein GYMLUDRAFT_232806 [Collybiopsis luxurians FD-317 M1]
MSGSASFPLQILRPKASYTAVSISDDLEVSSEELDVTSLSEQDWKGRRRNTSDSQATLVDSKGTSYLDLDDSPDRFGRFSRVGSARWRWKRRRSSLQDRLPTGWRFGAWLATFQAGTVLLANIIILIWSAVRTGGDSSGLVFQGDCNEVDHISIGIHLVINVLSTLLLGASNYIMQSLCAPTRREVDEAHERGSWLDIGLQSLRNLSYTSRRKRLLWIALSASSIPLHLFYNSSFFSTLSANEYSVYIAQGPEQQNIPRNDNGTHKWECGYRGCPGSVSGSAISSWEILSPSDCITAYTSDFVSDRSTVIAVVGDYVSNGSLIFTGTGYTSAGYNEDPYEWICAGMDDFDNQKLCSSVWRNIDPSKWKIEGYIYSLASVQSFSVNYCISQPVDPKCQLNFNLPLLIIVIFFNVVKVVCMGFTAIRIKDDPLVTIGDAIASFIDNPDPHTKNMCLASRSYFDTQIGDQRFPPLCIEYQPRKSKWMNAASRRHWILTVCLFAGAISVILGLLIYALLNLKSQGSGVTSLADLWQFGLGKPHSQNIIQGWQIPTEGYGALVAAVLISNSPQLILSMIYLVFNSLCTTLFLTFEWSLYARSCKPLRVSSPSGNQRSTYFLQIPYRYGLPLMVFSALLHWLVSQSIFLVKVSYWETWDNSNDILDSYQSVTSCGYSPMGMILTIIVGASLILLALIFAFFTHLNGDMPLVGSCSAAISAACHPPEDGKNSSMPVKWGAVIDASDFGKQGVGHTCFSSGVVVEPIPGCYYS